MGRKSVAREYLMMIFEAFGQSAFTTKELAHWARLEISSVATQLQKLHEYKLLDSTKITGSYPTRLWVLSGDALVVAEKLLEEIDLDERPRLTDAGMECWNEDSDN